MLAIAVTVAPVFLLIASGYAAVRFGYLPGTVADGLNSFAVKIAVPVLLFRALERLDIAAAFSLPLIVSFYAGAFTCFAVGILLARKLFRRRPGEAVAVGFAATFSNSVLLGLAIIERSHGTGPLTPAFGIIALHSPMIYAVGITTMELMRRDGRSLAKTFAVAGRSMIANPLMIGILLGAIVNLTGHWLPEPVMAGVDMLATAAIPVSLVGVGAAMTRYQMTAQLPEAGMVAALSLILHPTIAFTLSHYVFQLPPDAVRAAVMLAAMPPGMNIYLFAVMYDRAVNLAASAFLLATMLSIVTASFWIYVLNHIAFG
ncbi:MAG: malonate transporter [Ahrensia sp.]|nr:malonate transporter [Ahrensia sp.]